MHLVDTPGNSSPQGGEVFAVTTADGLRLRCARWMPAEQPRGTILISTGRAEAIEKYFETIGELLARNLCVVIFDWRGQGHSARQLRDVHKGHIADFDEYQRDLDAVIAKILKDCPKPWFALGHSMGGAILLEHAHRAGADNPFSRMILSAPMIDLVLRWPNLARVAAALLNGCGLGRLYVPTGGPAHIVARGFEGNPLTCDRFRFERLATLLSGDPSLSLGDPTIGWVRAAFQQMARFKDSDFPKSIRTPMLIFAPQADVVTDSFAAERFATRLKLAQVIWIPSARHEVLMERDDIRARFWAGFDAFVPGTPACMPEEELG